MLLENIKEAFISNYDDEYAPKMEAYMKGHFEYLGIKSPARKDIQKTFYTEILVLSEQDKIILCRDLWKLSPREFQYFAIDILNKYFKKPSQNHFNNAFHFITTKSWWDSVDALASNFLGNIILHNPYLISEMDKWIKSDDFWVRRGAIIFQLKYKNEVDEARLFRYCEECMHEKEFFIRKAIGWALRQHSRINPKAVVDFVSTNENQLSTLSKREALKLMK